MGIRSRKFTAIVCASMLLIVQAMPAFAICTCDIASGHPCRCAPPDPVAKDGDNCCAETLAEPIDCCAEDPAAEAAEQLALCSQCCDKDVVGAEFYRAALPADYSQDGKQKSVAILAALGKSIDDTSTESRGRFDRGRGPPPSPPAPVFLLNSAFLI